MSYSYAVSSDRSERIVVYRAGSKSCPSFDYDVNTDKGPTFDDDGNTVKVWLVTNRNLYYPLHQDYYLKRRQTKGTNPDVCLWQTDITKSAKLMVEDHPKFRGVCVVQLKKRRAKKSAKGKETRKLISELRSLKWVETSPFECQGGVSLISFSMLVYAINVYLDDNDPETPKDFNFQAELKAASHWDWLDDETRCLELGPYDDRRVKLAAKQTFDKWVEELDKKREPSFKKSKKESGFSDEDEGVSDLEEGIFALMMYYDFETKNKSSATCQSTAESKRKYQKTSMEPVKSVAATAQ